MVNGCFLNGMKIARACAIPECNGSTQAKGRGHGHEGAGLADSVEGPTRRQTQESWLRAMVLSRRDVTLTVAVALPDVGERDAGESAGVAPC